MYLRRRNQRHRKMLASTIQFTKIVSTNPNPPPTRGNGGEGDSKVDRLTAA